MSSADAVEVVAQAIHDEDDNGFCEGREHPCNSEVTFTCQRTAQLVVAALLATGSTEYGVRYRTGSIEAWPGEDGARIEAHYTDGASVVQRRSVLVTSAWENTDVP